MQTTSQPSVTAPAAAITTSRVNWLHVGWFLGLTFGLTWLADLVLYLNGGLASPVTSLLLQFQMLLPAFSAMVLGLFLFKESPIYFHTNRTRSRWFVYYYLLLTCLYLIGLIAGLIQPQLIGVISSLLLIPNLIGLILLVVLRLVKGGREAFASTGLAGGKWQVWLVFGLGLILFYGLQAGLNYVFKLGTVSDLKTNFPQLAVTNMSSSALILLTALNTLIIGPFLGLIIAFGEEYGWRGYLQTELIRLGRIRGVFLVGVIWGIWHWPVIWMGYNYPGEPVLGSIAMVVWCILLAYFLAYAVFKSKGVWTAAYLHALNNQTLSFFFMAVLAPNNNIFSFGAGLPGIALGLIVVLLILRDPVWKIKGSEDNQSQ
jgi:membrane protease YdiL (CAAX protease family)